MTPHDITYGLIIILLYFMFQTEGFALDWSSTVPGRLATGDCNGNIYLWTPTPDGSWKVDQQLCSTRTKSVEDIQWSPNEASVRISVALFSSL